MSSGVTKTAACDTIADRYLFRPTTKQKMLLKVMQSPDSRFQPICKRLTMEECASALKSNRCCDDVHFKVIYYPQTDPSLGYCSYLNTCHRTSRCKYLHFQPIRHPDAPPFEWKTIYDDDPLPIRTDQPYAAAGSEGSNLYGYAQADLAGPERLYLEAPIKHPSRALYAHGLQKYTRQSTTGDDTADLMPPQWIDADLKNFDYSILGKFDVIVADPPWDIHMSLPYGTMSDDDMRAMPFPQLQEEGFLFLWVTGRAMELGRELLAFWNYTRLDELIWVKVGQTQRLIRTGRTGHWLNHSKEHLLIGVKRKTTSEDPLVSPLTSLSTTYSASHAPGLPASCLIPEWANTGLDADVIVAEVRDTSRKPDELYSIIERLCPKGRKVELFGRRHNSRPGWITVGNQLKGDNIVDEELKRKVASWRNNNHSVSYS